ncbi:MAG: cache domain-containing protein, partial [Syntrophobacterales bacterium]|nr:cache domain-containing protein [Syntrophobacterales bacterium]
MIGVISAGVRLDTDEAVDHLKEHFNADISVFMGDTRKATTIFDNGERLTGTRLNPDIARIVLTDKKEYFGNAGIMGENYSTFYMPILNAKNEAFAMLFAGHSNESLIAEENTIIISGILIGLAGLVISVIVLLFITAKITNPVNQLVGLVSDVTHGNVNVDIDYINITKDEIGVLTSDVYSMVGIIKSLVNDLSHLTSELNIYS